MRAVVLALIGMVAVAAGACAQSPSATAGPGSGLRVELLAVEFIPPNHAEYGRVGGLSGLCAIESADESARFYVISDQPGLPRVFTLDIKLAADEDSKTGYALSPALVDEIDLQHIARDGESIAQPVAGSLLLGYEAPASIGAAVGETSTKLDLPDEIEAHARTNRGFESCAARRLTTGGIECWAATESALTIDGPEADRQRGTRSRVLVLQGDYASELRVRSHFFYESEARPPGLNHKLALHSLAEFEFLPGADGRLLALERSFDLPFGYEAQIFVVDGSSRTEPDAEFPILNKSRLLNFSDLGLPAIGNLEAMAVGPELSELLDDPTERGRLLLVIADDNFGADHQRRGSQVIALRLYEVAE